MGPQVSVHRERLALTRPAERLRDELLGSGLIELPLAGDAALAAAGLEAFHADPADRFIVATALASGAAAVPLSESQSGR
jgi:PIN domain nuclease of toxin-antitoxin system